MSDDGEGGPSLARYIAGLPGGLDAYPAAQAKGSLVRSVLGGRPVAELLPRLPPALRSLAAEPPIGSDWVPEAHLGALIHAIAEHRGYTRADVLAWLRVQNLALFTSPVYRVLMLVASPEALLRHAGRRWGNWHRGSTLGFEGFADEGACVTLAFPVGLFDGLLVAAYGAVFGAALEVAHAKHPVVGVDASGPGFARYVARW